METFILKANSKGKLVYLALSTKFRPPMCDNTSWSSSKTSTQSCSWKLVWSCIMVSGWCLWRKEKNSQQENVKSRHWGSEKLKQFSQWGRVGSDKASSSSPCWASIKCHVLLAQRSHMHSEFLSPHISHIFSFELYAGPAPWGGNANIQNNWPSSTLGSLAVGYTLPRENGKRLSRVISHAKELSLQMYYISGPLTNLFLSPFSYKIPNDAKLNVLVSFHQFVHSWVSEHYEVDTKIWLEKKNEFQY